MKALYGLDQQEIESWVISAGLPKFRAAQILDWLYKKHALSWDEVKNLPQEARLKLSGEIPITSLEAGEENPSPSGGSSKFLFKTHDGHFLESVLISGRDRETVCVSTQLGCKIGCAFCASGKSKFLRNLTAGEIVEQVARISRMSKKKITNIVFMGMGEPLDNLEEVLKSIRILNEPWGFGIGARRITVSTSGLVPGILEFVKRADGRVRLSISIHSSIDAVRDTLVPINKKYNLKELCKTLQRVRDELSREITFEYTLISGVNDSDEEAEGLVFLAKPLRAKINVIPYNPIREFDGKRPSREAVNRFCSALEKKGLKVMLRGSPGDDVDAACGQLRLDRIKSTEYGVRS